MTKSPKWPIRVTIKTANIIDAKILLTSSPDMYKYIYRFFRRKNIFVVSMKFKFSCLIVA